MEDGPDVKIQTQRVWHEFRCFGPFCFFDIHEGQESQPSGSGSRVNIDEVEFIVAMYLKLVTRYPELKSSSRLAIISPYNYQVKLLKDRFKQIFKEEAKEVVDIITVDGCQVCISYETIVICAHWCLFMINIWDISMFHCE